MELFFDMLKVESSNAFIPQLGVKVFFKGRNKEVVIFITLMLGLKDSGKYCSAKTCICSYLGYAEY